MGHILSCREGEEVVMSAKEFFFTNALIDTADVKLEPKAGD